jgi:hypothetical protein
MPLTTRPVCPRSTTPFSGCLPVAKRRGYDSGHRRGRHDVRLFLAGAGNRGHSPCFSDAANCVPLSPYTPSVGLCGMAQPGIRGQITVVKLGRPRRARSAFQREWNVRLSGQVFLDYRRIDDPAFPIAVGLLPCGPFTILPANPTRFTVGTQFANGASGDGVWAYTSGLTIVDFNSPNGRLGQRVSEAGSLRRGRCCYLHCTVGRGPACRTKSLWAMDRPLSCSGIAIIFSSMSGISYTAEFLVAATRARSA